jgi:hypothetical protein
MSSAAIHARRSHDRWGGAIEVHLEIHEFLDQTKDHLSDNRHRMILHNELGISLAKRVFGERRGPEGEEVPVEEVARQHIVEDLGYVPTVAQCLADLEIQPWMAGAAMYVGAALGGKEVAPPVPVKRDKAFSRRAFLGSAAAAPVVPLAGDRQVEVKTEKSRTAWAIMETSWDNRDEYTYAEGAEQLVKVYYDKGKAEAALVGLKAAFFAEYPDPDADFRANFWEFDLDETATWEELLAAGHPEPYYLQEIAFEDAQQASGGDIAKHQVQD